MDGGGSSQGAAQQLGSPAGPAVAARQLGSARGTAVAAQRLSVAITRLRARLREEAGVDGTGLSVSQMSVLWHILQAGPVTAAELAAAQHVSPQSIAQNLAVLKAAGLIHTERAGRTKLHQLTTEPLREITQRWPPSPKGPN